MLFNILVSERDIAYIYGKNQHETGEYNVISVKSLFTVKR